MERLSESPRCVASGKLRFVKRREAKKAAKKIACQHKKKYRLYRCPFCGGWHLTTQVPREAMTLEPKRKPAPADSFPVAIRELSRKIWQHRKDKAMSKTAVKEAKPTNGHESETTTMTPIARQPDQFVIDIVREFVEPVDPGPLADTDEKKLLYRVLRVRAQVAAEIIRVKAASKAMLDELEGRLKSIDFVYEGQVADITRGLLTGKAKSVKTPFGTVGFRKQPQKLEVEDEDKILAAVLAGDLPDEFMRTETRTTVAKSIINEAFEKTGEIPPGCVVRPECDAFYIKHEV